MTKMVSQVRPISVEMPATSVAPKTKEMIASAKKAKARRITRPPMGHFVPLSLFFFRIHSLALALKAFERALNESQHQPFAT